MTFQVKDLMVRVSGHGFDDTEPSTCTGWTKPSCVDSLWQHGKGRAAGRSGLSVLKAQLRQTVART